MTKRCGVDLKISRLMLMIGLMCERLRRFEEGEQILNAMKAYRDDLPHPSTALGLCYMSQGKKRESLRELEAVNTAFPEFQMNRVLRAVALRDNGHPGWRRCLEDVIRDGREAYSVKLAEQILGLEQGKGVAAADSNATPVDDVPRADRMYA